MSILALQEKAKNLIQPGNPEFKASHGLIEKFFSRHKLSLRSHTSVRQKLPSQLESVLTKFYADAAKFIRIGKYPLSLVGNMDETPAFFDMVPSKCIAPKGTKECVVCTSGGEKKHLTFVLSATGDGKILPPMIIFKGKTDRTISDLNIPVGFIVKTQEKAWMDLMKVWVEDIWIKHIRAECQKLGFENVLLTFDAFAVHLTDDVESQFVEAKTDTLAIPVGCTSKCQPMDVCLNKPFKAILRKCWVNYISSVVETFPDASQDPSFKIPTPTRQQMVDWVKEAFDYLTRNQEMVKHSFEVCGITVSDTEKVFSKPIGNMQRFNKESVKQFSRNKCQLYNSRRTHFCHVDFKT